MVRWIDVFTRKTYRDIVIDRLRFCQQMKGLEIFAFVVMSNHVHAILRSSISLNKWVYSVVIHPVLILLFILIY